MAGYETRPTGLEDGRIGNPAYGTHLLKATGFQGSRIARDDDFQVVPRKTPRVLETLGVSNVTAASQEQRTSEVRCS